MQTEKGKITLQQKVVLGRVFGRQIEKKNRKVSGSTKRTTEARNHIEWNGEIREQRGEKIQG